MITFALFTMYITFPLRSWAEQQAAHERDIRTTLKPQEDKIKALFKGEERHYKIKELYAKYAWRPIYALRSSLPLLVQLPFLYIVWDMASHTSFLSKASFYAVRDLSLPDALWVTKLLQ